MNEQISSLTSCFRRFCQVQVSMFSIYSPLAITLSKPSQLADHASVWMQYLVLSLLDANLLFDSQQTISTFRFLFAMVTELTFVPHRTLVGPHSSTLRPLKLSLLPFPSPRNSKHQLSNPIVSRQLFLPTSNSSLLNLESSNLESTSLPMIPCLAE